MSSRVSSMIAAMSMIMLPQLVMSQTSHKGNRDTMYVLGIATPVIKDRDALMSHNGHLVVLLGKVSRGKIPRIHGVEVSCAENLIGKTVIAKGILVGLQSRPEGRAVARTDEETQYVLYSDLRGTLSACEFDRK